MTPALDLAATHLVDRVDQSGILSSTPDRTVCKVFCCTAGAVYLARLVSRGFGVLSLDDTLLMEGLCPLGCRMDAAP